MEKYQNQGLNLSTKVINIFYGHGEYYLKNNVSTYLKKTYYRKGIIEIF